MLAVPAVFILLIPIADGQIGVTTCTFATQNNCPTFLLNSYCDLGTLTCECAAAGRYEDDGTGIACTYNCGTPNAPTNGGVTYPDGTHTGDVATYSCNNGYKVVGSTTTTCVQDSGWDSTTTTCRPVVVGDDCSNNIFLCTNIINGVCYNLDTCQCLAGYEQKDNGTACEEIDECASAPCQHGGTCSDGMNGYSCTCSAGYVGVSCETDFDECASAPCQHGSTCNDVVNGYSCTCPAGYTGVNCQTNINECASQPCRNGATCEDGSNSYTCICVSGFDGADCENNINECAGNQYCQNGATCSDGIARFTCLCATGFTGYYCENTFTDQCTKNPCQNEGVCIDTSEGFYCYCAAGYYGKTCALRSEIIDEKSIIIWIVMAVAVVLLALYAFYITCLLKRRISNESRYQSVNKFSKVAAHQDTADSATKSPGATVQEEINMTETYYTDLDEALT